MRGRRQDAISTLATTRTAHSAWEHTNAHITSAFLIIDLWDNLSTSKFFQGQGESCCALGDNHSACPWPKPTRVDSNLRGSGCSVCGTSLISSLLDLTSTPLGKAGKPKKSWPQSTSRGKTGSKAKHTHACTHTHTRSLAHTRRPPSTQICVRICNTQTYIDTETCRPKSRGYPQHRHTAISLNNLLKRGDEMRLSQWRGRDGLGDVTHCRFVTLWAVVAHVLCETKSTPRV